LIPILKKNHLPVESARNEAITSDVQEVKQLDNGIDDTLALVNENRGFREVIRVVSVSQPLRH
jgi:hypothetical protein